MQETVYSAEPELIHPLRFARAAVVDLRHSVEPAWQLFRRNLQGRYRRAWLGYTWLLLPTVGTTGVWLYVQSRQIIEVAPTDLPYPVYVLAGTILWQLFVDALNAPLQHLTAGKQLITRSTVPHEALVLAGAFEVLLNCAVRLVALMVVLLAFRTPVGLSILFVPAGIGSLLLLGLGLGLLAAPWGLLYDDVSRLLSFVTGFWFFLTPIVYRAPAAGLLALNPVTPLLETSRAWLTGGQAAGGFSRVTIAAAAMLIVAWLVQRMVRPHVVARLG
jgi:lipopolysaccharide transport system permease protein